MRDQLRDQMRDPMRDQMQQPYHQQQHMSPQHSIPPSHFTMHHQSQHMPDLSHLHHQDPYASFAPPPPMSAMLPPNPTPNPLKRRLSDSPDLNALSMPAMDSTRMQSMPSNEEELIPAVPAETEGPPAKKSKKGRINVPWTPAEERRLKVMRDAGNSWSEIAKVRGKWPQARRDIDVAQGFPTRTEGSVKKHWYKVRARIASSVDDKLMSALGHALRRICRRRGASAIRAVFYAPRVEL
ncbi:hypothetical protein MRB53_037938 [Persea americana]|nr:hypothetical protein MRB53_037938 [Persea americana]